MAAETAPTTTRVIAVDLDGLESRPVDAGQHRWASATSARASASPHEVRLSWNARREEGFVRAHVTRASAFAAGARVRDRDRRAARPPTSRRVADLSAIGSSSSAAMDRSAPVSQPIAIDVPRTGAGFVEIQPPPSRLPQPDGNPPVAQLAEQAAVNRWVVGSSPTRGAIASSRHGQRHRECAPPPGSTRDPRLELPRERRDELHPERVAALDVEPVTAIRPRHRYGQPQPLAVEPRERYAHPAAAPARERVLSSAFAISSFSTRPHGIATASGSATSSISNSIDARARTPAARCAQLDQFAREAARVVGERHARRSFARWRCSWISAIATTRPWHCSSSRRPARRREPGASACRSGSRSRSGCRPDGDGPPGAAPRAR